MIKVIAGDLTNSGIDQFLVLNDGAGNIDLRFYLLLVGAYLLIAIPLAYLIMAKLKKLNLLKWAVVLVALIFSILIFLEGNKTRFEAPFYYYARVVEVTSSQPGSDQVREWVFAQFTSPYNGSFEIRFQPEYNVTLVDYESDGVLLGNPGNQQFSEGENGPSFQSSPGQGMEYLPSEGDEGIASIGRILLNQPVHYLQVESPNVLTCHGVHPFEKHFLTLSTIPKELTEEKKAEIDGIRREEQFHVEIRGDSWYLVDPLGGERSETYPVGNAAFDELAELVPQMGYKEQAEAYRKILSRYVRSHSGDMTVSFCKERDVHFSTQSNSKYFGYTVLVEWKEDQNDQT